jgi:autotransporter-associated beta strand protein
MLAMVELESLMAASSQTQAQTSHKNPNPKNPVSMKPNKSNSFRSGVSAVLSVLTLGCFTASSALAATRTWDGGNSDPASAGQWNVNAFANWNGAIVNGDDLVFGITNANGWTLTSVGAARDIKSLTFQSGSPAYDIRLSSTVSGGTSQSLTFISGNTGITVEPGDTSSHNIGLALGSLILEGNLTATHNGSGTLTISRPITGSGFGLTKEGSGLMKLDPPSAAPNTYSGATQVNGGILTIGRLAAKGSTSGITVGASGIIGIGVDNIGSTTHYLAADVVALFNRLSDDPALTGNLAGYSLNDASGVAVDTTAAAAFVDSGSALTAPNRSLTKIGTGTYRLNQTNTYTGPTIIKQGTLSLGAALNGGALSPSSAITVESGATFAVSKNNAAVQGTNFSSAAISGGGNFVQLGGNAGTGVTTLNVANTFSGTTTISGGLLTLSNALALQNSALDTADSIVSSSATTGLKTTVTTLTLGGLSGDKDLATLFNAANGYSGVTALTLNPQTGKSNTYSGIIADGAPGMSLTKTGAGTQTLSGANTYTGATNLSQGTLILNNATALGGNNPGVNGTSSIAMAAGTTLRSNYIIADAGNVDSFVYAPITLSGAGSVNFHPGAGSSVAPPEAVTFNLNGAIGGTAGTNVVFSSPSANLGNADSIIVLGAASTYDGNTTITAGNNNDRLNVKAGVANALPTTTVLTLGDKEGAGTFRSMQYDLNGNDQTLAGLDNGGNVPLLRRQAVTNSSGTAATLTINNSADFIFGGANFNAANSSTTRAQITGNLALVKDGAGTLTLDGTLANGATAAGNTYTGNTTVNEGILRIGFANPSNQSSTVTIAESGATLDLTYSGTDTVDKLFIGDTQLDAGEYGPTATPIPQITNSTGTGTLTVTSGPAGGFSAWQTANSTLGSLDEDHDDDGVSNGIEFFIYGPVANSGFTALPPVVNTGGTLSVTFTKAAGYTGTYGTHYAVETSATLADPWVPQIADPDPGFTVTFPSPTEVKYTFPAGTKNFARLKVTGP